MWRANEKGAMEFVHGKEAWALAEQAALACSAFVPDVEEEQVAGEERSCYDCRYRRWSVESFTCLSGAARHGESALVEGGTGGICLGPTLPAYADAATATDDRL